MSPAHSEGTHWQELGSIRHLVAYLDQALKIAQDYLDRVIPGTKVNEADTFYGYYTMEVTKDSKIFGMISVNSNTGAVWYHTWHGTFEKLLEVK